jgi:hypothetical protein
MDRYWVYKDCDVRFFSINRSDSVFEIAQSGALAMSVYYQRDLTVLFVISDP